MALLIARCPDDLRHPSNHSAYELHEITSALCLAQLFGKIEQNVADPVEILSRVVD